MKIYYLLVSIVIAIFGTVYWYQSTASVCPVPLEYRLGDIDSGFGLSDEQVLEHIAKAESVWEDAANRELFIYNEQAEMPINLIFDERQEFANTEEEKREDLDYRYSESKSLKLAIDKLTSEYDSLIDSYNSQAVAYEVRLNEYNNVVAKYNDEGGAPEEVYEELKSERNELNNVADSLNEIQEKISELATEINQLGDRGNTLMNSYNEDVKEYNLEYGEPREFTQGDYKGDSINIYKFSSDNELHKVLAHEFGHALGLDHVEGTSSLMYYLLGDTSESPTLSSEDLEVYYAMCGTYETFSQKLRRIIRDLIN